MKRFVSVVLLAAIASPAHAEKPRYRIDFAPGLIEASGQDRDPEQVEPLPLAYEAPGASLALTAIQPVAANLAIHGGAFGELGAKACGQWVTLGRDPDAMPREVCVGESWARIGGVAGGVTIGSDEIGIYAALSAWGGVLWFDDPYPHDVDEAVAPWFGADVAVGKDWRISGHRQVGVVARLRRGRGLTDDDFRDMTSIALGVSLSTR